MVTRLDRLARSTRDFLTTLATVTGKGAGFRSLNDTWADKWAEHDDRAFDADGARWAG
jgi:DNA invertase Pin-like site-specific DNA recombinase